MPQCAPVLDDGFDNYLKMAEHMEQTVNSARAEEDIQLAEDLESLKEAKKFLLTDLRRAYVTSSRKSCSIEKCVGFTKIRIR